MENFKVGQRVQLHAATSAWMQGDRCGTVTGHGRRRTYVETATGSQVMARPVLVRLDVSGRVWRAHPENLFAID